MKSPLSPPSRPACPLVLAAMAEEEAAVLDALAPLHPELREPQELEPRFGVQLRAARDSRGTPSLLLARSGMGPVNAALTLALIARARPEVDAVILLGVGGALRPELRLGELILSGAVLQHDSFASHDTGDARMRPGALVLSPADAVGHEATHPAGPGLLSWLRQAAPHARVGTVLSGSEFVGTVERKRALASLHADACLVDMEAAGVAQVAHRLGLPFVVAKTVADRLNPDGTIESDFWACLEAAAGNAAGLLQSAWGSRA